MLIKHKHLYRTFIVVGAVIFLLLYSVSFSEQRFWTTIWFLGEKGHFGSHGPIFAFTINGLIYFASFLLGVVLVRQIPIFSELPKRWKYIVTYLVLALLCALSAYGVLLSSLTAMSSPDQFYGVYITRWIPFASAVLAAVCIFLWDLLAPRVRKAFHRAEIPSQN